MPKSEKREYRAMPLLASSTNRRIESDYYIEGHATTFNQPYVLFECNGIEYKECVDSHAFDECDLSDVIFQYDHEGRVLAAIRNKSLIVEVDSTGLFVAADLSLSDASRSIHNDIETGLIKAMSFGFVVEESSYNEKTHTRTILKVKKVYDVSAVSIPANPSTDISTRNWLDGAIEAERKEFALRAENNIRKRKLLLKMEVEKILC